MENEGNAMQLTAVKASRTLHSLANPDKARILSGFFKTGKGQYGEGDRFLGVMVPQTRSVAKTHRDLPLLELDKLIRSPWHEERLLALIILVQRVLNKPSDLERKQTYDFYVKHMDYINNWDLVDLSAPQVVGGYLWEHPAERGILDRWINSERLWDRRVAILATFTFIRQGHFNKTLRLAQPLLEDPEDLLHKAVGWMLREVGKRDKHVLMGFLDRHASRMPRTMLRYSLEKLNPSERRSYMDQGKTRQRHR
jgi:3-methyladenine DNA glycosylase AlkD